MIRIGLTGGIGAGKSTVSATFAECGGIIVDADVIAREVVEPGTEGLAALVGAFGPEILRLDGALDRPVLAAIAFSNDEKRATVNAIVHPLVGERRAELIAAAPASAVIVEDIPLLVETGMAPMFPLVVIVHADVDTRLARLTGQRGMSEGDARARIAAQATEEQRRAVADVWLDNSGTADELAERARTLWCERIVPFEHNIRTGQPAQAKAELVPYNPEWPDQAQRIINRIQTACGAKALRVDHIGATAVPGLDAKDDIDVQVTVAWPAALDEIADAVADIGYPRIEHITSDVGEPDARSTVPEYDHTGEHTFWQKRIHAAADPGRAATVQLRVDGWPNQQFALLFPEWLKANPDVREEYAAIKFLALTAPDYSEPDYSEALAPRFLNAYRRAWEWADATGWRP